MESIWSKTTEIPKYQSLSGDVTIEAAVIGGGMAGILTAFFLQKHGVNVIILEASRIGSGQTKNTTAKITSQHNLIYDKLIQDFGEEKAKQYAAANQRAISEYRRIITENSINCHFEECPAYLYSLSTEKAEVLKREAHAAQRLGIDGEFTLETVLPFPVVGAVKFNGQAQFHPLEFLQAVSKNLTIFEHTKVKAVENDCVVTNRGIVTAKHIVFATHYPFVNRPGFYFARMHQERSYVLALEHAMQLDGMYLGIDEDGLSLRNSGNLLLLGGGGHRTGENRAGGKYDMLRKKALQFWPDSIETTHWSAQDCMTLDGVPYIGQFSASTPNWYVATGFGKWGMTSSMVSAMLLADGITGTENPNAEVFSPRRFTPSASAKAFLAEGGQAVKGLTRQVVEPSRADIEDLPNGHGGVVEYGGDKVGVYKDNHGQVFLVSTRCPHLGCQLEWNPDEKSWDCPCHGSRFDYTGRLLDNPAQEDLENANHD